MTRREQEKRKEVTRYKVVVRESYEQEFDEDDFATKEAAKQAIKNHRDEPSRTRSVKVLRDYRVVPYKTYTPEKLPQPGDLMYVPSGLENVIGGTQFRHQDGIEGGVAKVSQVYELDRGSGEWYVEFDKLGRATYSHNFLRKNQNALKKKFGIQNAKPTFSEFSRMMEVVHDAMEGDWK